MITLLDDDYRNVNISGTREKFPFIACPKKDMCMAKIKAICYLFILVVYVISSVMALSDLDILNVSPFLASACAVFGMLGGIILFSSMLKKFREDRKRGLHVHWYSSSSILFGNFFVVIGFVTLAPVLKFVILPKEVAFGAELIFRAVIIILMVIFLILASIYRRKEE